MARKLTQYQLDLCAAILPLLPANTHELTIALGHRQSYETNLRDRLFRLYNAGLIGVKERIKNGVVRERIWTKP